MLYLHQHLQAKKNPQSHFSGFQSVFSVGMSYVPHPAPRSVFKAARIALYAQGDDYHRWLKEKLQHCAQTLSQEFPDERFLVLTDSAPFLERDQASAGGIGWIGKNTCLLIRPNGSLFLIGEILTSLKSPQKSTEGALDFCGTCNRCLEACPTGAFIEPRKLDARKCISYWTIESRKIPPEDLRSQIGDWLFGCDICQTVCPWNQKTLMQLTNPQHPRRFLVEDLREILTLSGKKLEKKIQSTPLQRAGTFGLRRNAMIVAGNLRLLELEPEIKAWGHDQKLGKLALETVKKIHSS